MTTEGKISQFLRAVRLSVVSDVPTEYQACEACRSVVCSSDTASKCKYRVVGETQEKRRRAANGC